ncbi:MAG: cytochrome c [Actinomycetota bacterium]|nr:cytochrome c [Actinomycetota bacterium]
MRVLLAGSLFAVAIMLAAACGGGGGGGEAAGTTAAETGATTARTPAGDAARGRDLFTSIGCANCHTLQAAGATGTVGPNLDKRLKQDAKSARMPLPEFTRESIVDPNAFVAPGFRKGVMPANLEDKLSDRQINDLVAFLVQSVRG